MERFDRTARIGHAVASIRVRVALLRLKSLYIKAGFRQDQSRGKIGRWDGGRGNVTVTRRTSTGNPRIDSKTDQILDIMKDVISDLGPGAGPTYGTQIHMACAEEIRRLDLPGIGKHGVEQSFSAGDVVRYGLDGSIRTDIVLRDGHTVDAPIMAVWDLKTGDAKLTPARIREIRKHLNIDESVPVLELHVRRGVNLKHHVYIDNVWFTEA